MQRTRRFGVIALVLVGGAVLAAPASAAQPRNPYSSFNLSGINYGAQQWDRDQRAGRVVWPYYNTPSRSYSRGSNVSVGGVAGGGMGGAVIQGGTYRSSPRTVRRWRR
jgi:hypothetical protein